MRFIVGRALLILALLFLPAPATFAQSVDPSGHWKGTVEIPGSAMPIEVDITKTGTGFAGTFSQPAQGLKGLPLASVTVNGRTVTFLLKAGTDASFTGTLAEGGTSITGQLTQAGLTCPFTLARAGEAKTAEEPKSAAVSKQFEGTWTGTLDLGGQSMTLVMKIANRPDRTSTATLASSESGQMEFAAGLTQKGKVLTAEVPSISGSFVGTLNDAGTELAGTWTMQGLGSLPLTLKKFAK